MKSMLVAATVLFAGLLAPAHAEDEAAVPIEKAPFHLPVFKNDYVTMLKIDLPPHRTTGFHTHSTDSVSVNIGPADMANQLPGQPQTPPRHSRRGEPSFTAYSKKPPVTHRATNMGETYFHNVSFLLNKPAPSGFQPSTRDGAAGFTQVMDNERVRGWHLVLAPGETSGTIAQTAPGLRIVLDGSEIAELVPGAAPRGMNLRSGEFYWQEPGTRAVKNTGTTPLELFEFELK